MPLQYSTYVVKELLSNSASLANVTIGNVILTGNLTVSNSQSTGAGAQDVLDDISPYFNGITKTFILKVNGNPVTPKSPYALDIFLGQLPVFATVHVHDYFNLTEIEPFDTGYEISGSTISFVTPPLPWMKFFGIIKYLTPQNYTLKQTPFSPINIMLGY